MDTHFAAWLRRKKLVSAVLAPFGFGVRRGRSWGHDPSSRQEGGQRLAGAGRRQGAEGWFRGAFKQPTRAQQLGWPAIAGGDHTLLAIGTTIPYAGRKILPAGSVGSGEMP